MAKIQTVLQGFSLGTDQGNVAFCGVHLVESTRRILVDVAHVGRRLNLVQKLQERGLTPGDIDAVYLTHAHWDHMLNVDLFPNATVYIHPIEREYCKAPDERDWATPAYISHILESRRLEEVQEGEEIDDGVRVLHTPGHSCGSTALLVQTDNGVECVSGDALPNGLAVKTGLPRNIFWDVDDAKRSIRKLLDAASSFYPGHDRPFRVHDGNRVTYLEPTGVQVVGWPEPGEGEAPGTSYALGGLRMPNIAGRATGQSI